MQSVSNVRGNRQRKVFTPEEIAKLPLHEWDPRLQKRNLPKKGPPEMPKNDVRFTALMTADDDKKLEALAKLSGDSKNQILRRGLRALYAMDVLGRPTCANGHACFVPNMHSNLQQHFDLQAPALPLPERRAV